MNVIKARNANQMLPEVMHQLKQTSKAEWRASRNGPVRKFVGPTTFQYERPTERVVFWAERDANPFFHLFESLWMLAGRNDVAYPARFSKNISQFSDDGKTFHGAYGYRWRNHFDRDQLATVARALTSNPDDRRSIVQMWDPRVDGTGNGKDYPCNLTASFQRDADGRLDMVVYNRSNDILWGALGANCVHFSILQEYMAAWIGCEVGQYWQVSANMHAYQELNPLLERCLPLSEKSFPSNLVKRQCPYELGVSVFPLVSVPIDQWKSELHMFLSDGGAAMGYRDPFFRRVATPMLKAYEAFSNRGDESRFVNAFNELQNMASCDWKIAAIEWLFVREQAASKKAQQAAAEAAKES